MNDWPTNRSERQGFAQPLAIAGVYDALTAAIAQSAGFDGLWVSGFCVSTSLGVKDSNILSAQDMCRRASEIMRVTSLPLIVDCDEGYGSTTSAVDAAIALGDLGVKTICIEDSRFPKANSFQEGIARHLEAPAEFCRKVEAIKSAVPTLEIMARTETLIVGGRLSEAVARSEQYAEAGADYILIHSRANTIEELRVLRDAWEGETPMVTIPTGIQGASLVDYERLGYKMVIFANQAMRAAIPAIQAALTQLITPVLPERYTPLVSMDHVFELVNGIERNTKLPLVQNGVLR
jgi:phosphoenolpyruvate phosphomutase